MNDTIDQNELRERRLSGRINRSGRRRGGRQLSIIFWRDIPAQITARDGTEQHKVLLHARFQHAIDRAAGIAGLTSTDDYVRQWRTSNEPIADGNVKAHLNQRRAEIEEAFSRDRLETIVANSGINPDVGAPTPK